MNASQKHATLVLETSPHYQKTKCNGYYWDGDVLIQTGRFSVDFQIALSKFPDDLRSEFKDLFIKFIDLNQYSSSSYWTFATGLNTALRKTTPRIFSVEWLSEAIKTNQLKAGTKKLSRLFEFINQRNPLFFDGDILIVLHNLRARKKIGKNVLSDDPEVSRLTKAEFDAIVWETWNNFDKGVSSTQITLAKLFDCTYFRRPIQFAQLKIGDIYFDHEDDVSRIRAPRIFFPGAKDASSQSSFRDSKFEYRPLPDHFIELIRLQIHEVQKLFESVLKCPISESDLKKLPIFASKKQILDASKALINTYQKNPIDNLDHELFHLSSHVVGNILRWRSNAPMHLKRYKFAVDPPMSERTGNTLVVNATRMRHTGAFSLARRGVSRSLLSYIMGHASSKSIEAYYKDPAEEARVLDEAMKGSLSQLQMAFTGKLLGKDEHLKLVKISPESILEHHADQKLSSVGNCGRHSFCSTQTIPIPCYRCNSFQPFAYANHQQVLDALLARQQQEAEIVQLGSAKHLLKPVDLSSDITFVTNVIEQCELYKKNRMEDV